MARRDEPGPYSLEALAQIQTPAFFTVDAESWKARLVGWFEGETNRTLYPMQVEMLLIEALSYALAVLGEEAQMTAEQHLVVTASIEGLVALGPNRSTVRLDEAKARVPMRFSLSEVLPVNTVVPAGTRIGAGANNVFLTLGPAVIAAGSLTADVVAEAAEAGVGGNGFMPGQLSTMLDPVAGVTATNIATSSGGADAEDPELYRLRLANAFDRISPGGGRGWYRETTMGVSAAIVDVAVIRPQPCFVDIYPLTPAGAADATLRDQVKAAFDTREALEIRFGDEVTVKAAVAVPVSCSLTIWLRGETSGAQSVASGVANNVLDDWGQQLGAAVAPGRIEGEVKSVLKDLGFDVLDVQVTGMAFKQLAAEEFAVAVLLDPDDVAVEVVA